MFEAILDRLLNYCNLSANDDVHVPVKLVRDEFGHWDVLTTTDTDAWDFCYWDMSLTQVEQLAHYYAKYITWKETALLTLPL